MEGTTGGRYPDGAARRIERFFGELIDEVALQAPVSRRRLVEGLATLDSAARGADSPLKYGRDRVQVFEARIVVLPLEAWAELAEGLTAATEVAARETHRRMANTVTDVRLPPGTDPFVAIRGMLG